MSEFDEGFESDIARILLKGGVVPLLGAGVNAFGRPAATDAASDADPASDPAYTWCETDAHLPTGGELAIYLADYFGLKGELKESSDLIRVSQFIDKIKNAGDEMYEILNDIFVREYEPGPVHTFLARTAKVLRERGQRQVILTTNYDDLLERALDQAEEREPYHLITYISSGPEEYRGGFLHWPPGPAPDPRPIGSGGNSYSLGPEEGTVIVKLHGAVKRRPAEQGDNYVITEDDYIEYLTNTDISSQLPFEVTEKLRDSSFLFLGYSFKDWNLRAILRRVWGEWGQRRKQSWAIQKEVDPLEMKLWEKRTVSLVEFDLAAYIDVLNSALDVQIAREEKKRIAAGAN